MSRPEIPAEIERQILLECGHRCAVCGEAFPLEKAHIVPWHRSKEHKLEDLICLCPNCHSRADSEKWGEKTLREYKIKPWILRRRDEQTAQQTSQVRLTLAMELKAFDSRSQRLFTYAIAAFLDIPPECIQICSIESGSVHIRFTLPVDAAERLLSAVATGDEFLASCLLPFGGLAYIQARVAVDKLKEEADRLDLTPEKLAEKVRNVAVEATRRVKEEGLREEATLRNMVEGSSGGAAGAMSTGGVTTSNTTSSSEPSLAEEAEKPGVAKR